MTHHNNRPARFLPHVWSDTTCHRQSAVWLYLRCGDGWLLWVVLSLELDVSRRPYIWTDGLRAWVLLAADGWVVSCRDCAVAKRCSRGGALSPLGGMVRAFCIQDVCCCSQHARSTASYCISMLPSLRRICNHHCILKKDTRRVMWGRRAAVVRCLSDQPTAGPVGF